MAQSKKKPKYIVAGFRIEETRMDSLKKLAREKSVEENKTVTVTSLIDSAVENAYGI